VLEGRVLSELFAYDRRRIIARADLRGRAMTPQPGTSGLPEASEATPLISVVIPTLNEARNLPYVLAKIPDGIHEVIVVDGHSVDETLEVARQWRPGVRIIMQNRKGKGNALACGIAAATGDIIATIDADGSADPGEIPRFVDALVNGADFAKGTRFSNDGGSSDITRLRAIGNRVLCVFVNILYGTKYSDLCYGYNAFWAHIVPKLGIEATAPPRDDSGPLWGDGFEVETLISIRVARAGLAVTEVPSFEYPRIHGVSNLSAVSDGMRVLRTILAEKDRSRRRRDMPIAARTFAMEEIVDGTAWRAR
jgi:glycosyltransferase involved in cell wall biosynthesis